MSSLVCLLSPFACVLHAICEFRFLPSRTSWVAWLLIHLILLQVMRLLGHELRHLGETFIDLFSLLRTKWIMKFAYFWLCFSAKLLSHEKYRIWDERKDVFVQFEALKPLVFVHLQSKAWRHLSFVQLKRQETAKFRSVKGRKHLSFVQLKNQETAKRRQVLISQKLEGT